MIKSKKKIIKMISSIKIVEYLPVSLQNKVQKIISVSSIKANKNKNLQVLAQMHKSKTIKKTIKAFYNYLLLLPLTPSNKFNRHKKNKIYLCKNKNQQLFKDSSQMHNLNYQHIDFITKNMMMNHLKIVSHLQTIEMKIYLRMR